MKRMKKAVTRWVQNQEGQGLTEYALIIALVGVALVATLTALAGGITGVLNNAIAAM